MNEKKVQQLKIELFIPGELKEEIDKVFAYLRGKGVTVDIRK